MIYGMKDIGRNIFHISTKSNELRKDEFWALKNTSFEVKKGECLGIIGANGSGKSTLLKLLNGIYMPDEGRITINGKVGALIQIGAGFNPMLSGRENIYVSASILGMSKKEIDEKFDSIVQFAGIGDFLDMPVKNYSSGMYVRLGFSIAVNIEPEVLLIDEVLAVGDLSFRYKSLRRLAELRDKTHAVIFVSHNMEQIINLCDNVMVLDNGRTIFMGETYDAIHKYEELTRDVRLKNLKRTYGLGKYKYYSSGDIEFLEGGVMDNFGKQIEEISMEDDIISFLRFRVKNPIENAKVGMTILNMRGVQCIWQFSNDIDKRKVYKFERGEHLVKVRFKKPKLVPGIYTLSFSIRNQKSGEVYEKNLGYMPTFKVTGKAFERGVIYAESEWGQSKIGNYP